MSNVWYPLLFTPLCREESWGGQLLHDHYNRTPETSQPVGFSYEIVYQRDNESVVENGEFQNKPIGELIKLDSSAFIGKKFKSADTFPLVIKYIDTEKRLPLQVHPDKEICRKLPNDPKPNTKIWYIIRAQKNAKILVGIKRNCTQQQFLTRIRKPELEAIIQSFPAEPGDAYFIVGGRVHALDAGNLILSIEQNSESTYRVSNWEEQQEENELSEKELENALKCIHFQDRTLPRIRGESSVVKRNRKIPLITNCPHFTVDDLRLVYDLHDFTDGSTFHILTVIDNPIVIKGNGHTVNVEPGRSCLLPAALGRYSLSPIENSSRVLKTSLRTDW